MLKQRIISVFIAAPIFIWLVGFAPNFIFYLAWTAGITAAAWEWGRLLCFSFERNQKFAAVVAGLSLITMMLATRYTASAFLSGVLFLLGLAVLLALPFLLTQYRRFQDVPRADIVLPIAGIVLFLGCSMATAVIRQLIGGVHLLGLFITVWACDIGAYFVGKRFGKTPFAPKISPNKTWEGFIGGWLSGVVICAVFLIFSHEFRGVESYFAFLMVTEIILIYAALGDLLESVLKRRAHVSNSGRCLPGHGGILDRIDSWLPTLILWACWLLIRGTGV